MKFIDKLSNNKVAWKAFMLFLKEEGFNTNMNFVDLKYEYQIGVFLRFFEHYGMTSSTYWGLFDLITTVDEWKETIILGFKNLEKEITNGTK